MIGRTVVVQLPQHILPCDWLVGICGNKVEGWSPPGPGMCYQLTPVSGNCKRKKNGRKKLCPPLLHHYFCFSEPHHVVLLWRASHLQPSFSHHLSSTITPALISLSAVDWLTSSWEKQWVLMGSPYLTFFTTHLFLVVSYQACTTVYS